MRAENDDFVRLFVSANFADDVSCSMGPPILLGMLNIAETRPG